MQEIPGLGDLAWVVLIAAVAPILVGLLPSPRPPEVVVLLVGGIVAGPHVIGLVETTQNLLLLSEIGLGFLFFVAGYEIDPRMLAERSARVALWAWLVAIVVALVAAFTAVQYDLVRAPFPVAIAMTTTALGTLMPIIKENGVMASPLGRFVITNGAVGEFAPLLAISLFLGTTGVFGAGLALAIVGAAAALTLVLPRRAGARVREIVRRGDATASQTLVRWTVVMLVLLLAVAARFGLDIVIGAFAAGIVLRIHRNSGTEDANVDLIRKIEAIAFGFFIPVFFVCSGITLDLPSIAESPRRLLAFVVGIFLIRALPVFLLHTRRIPEAGDRMRVALYSATGLPLIIAVTSIGLTSGAMLPENAAALVGAGVVTVLLFPLGAELIDRWQNRPSSKP